MLDFTFADSTNLVDDQIERTIKWDKGDDLSSLPRRTVRLRFVMQEADLYTIQFPKK